VSEYREYRNRDFEVASSNHDAGHFVSGLKQVANLLCAQANSASYPQLDGKRVVAHGLPGEGPAA